MHLLWVFTKESDIVYWKRRYAILKTRGRRIVDNAADETLWWNEINNVRAIQTKLGSIKEHQPCLNFPSRKKGGITGPLNQSWCVPQGSALRPLLFLLFTADFPNEFPQATTIVTFSNDMAVLLTNCDYVEITANLHIAVTHFFGWMRQCKMLINDSKSICSLRATLHRYNSIQVYNKVIPPSTKVCFWTSA